jgi:hypothetical protein
MHGRIPATVTRIPLVSWFFPMILDPFDDDAVSSLLPGHFAVPRPNQAFTRALPNTPRLERSIRAMTTVLLNRGFNEIVNTFQALPGSYRRSH